MNEKILILIAIVCLALFIMLFINGKYYNKILIKIGIKKSKPKRNWTALSWDSCLHKLDIKADVVFFGDSITRGSNFHEHFRHIKIVNLGCTEDTLCTMKERVSMVSAVNPEKVFVLGGINGLKDNNVDTCVKRYDLLLTSLQEEVPCAEIIVESVLPISKEKEARICMNSTIIEFNSRLKELAQKRNLKFLDIHKCYIKDGYINPDLTSDGIHLRPEAYVHWEKELETYLN